jgi:glycerol-3-phosphate dehydrogenase
MEGHGRIVILGGGSFGASVAIAVANRGHNVTLLVRKQALVDDINQRRRHPRFKDVILDERIKATNEPEQAFKPTQDGQPVDLIIHAVPVQVSREYLLSIRDHIPDGVPVLSCSKGIELKTNFFMHDLLNETLSNQLTGNPPKLAFMSGLVRTSPEITYRTSPEITYLS